MRASPKTSRGRRMSGERVGPKPEVERGKGNNSLASESSYTRRPLPHDNTLPVVNHFPGDRSETVNDCWGNQQHGQKEGVGDNNQETEAKTTMNDVSVKGGADLRILPRVSDGQKSSSTNPCMQSPGDPTPTTAQNVKQGRDLEASPTKPTGIMKPSSSGPPAHFHPSNEGLPTPVYLNQHDIHDPTKQGQQGRSKRWRRAPRKFDQTIHTKPLSSVPQPANQSNWHYKHLCDGTNDAMEVDKGARKNTCSNKEELGEKSEFQLAAPAEQGCWEP